MNRSLRPAASRVALAALAPLVAAGGCANVAEDLRDDHARVGADFERRAGMPAPVRPDAPDDGGVAAASRELLEDGLTEDEAVRVALLDHRGLRAELAELGVARAALARAALPPNPVLTANAKFFDGGTEVELGLAQSLLELVLLPVRREIAGARRAEVEAAVTRTLVHHVFDVRRAFADALAAERIVEVVSREVEAADAAGDLMRTLHAAGNATDPERTALEAGAARARLGLSEAQSAAFEAREHLNALLGLWGDATTWRVVGAESAAAPPDPRLAHVESRAVEASLDLAAQRARVAAAARRAGVRDWEAILAPAGAGVAVKRESGDDWGAGPAGSIALPLWDRGEASSVEARALLERELDLQVQLAVEIRAAARALRERARSSADRARHAREVALPLQARLVRETIQNYNAMQVGAFPVLAARAGELAAERHALELERDARRARLDLEELLAGSLARERVEARAQPPAAPQPARADGPAGGHSP